MERSASPQVRGDTLGVTEMVGEGVIVPWKKGEVLGVTEGVAVGEAVGDGAVTEVEVSHPIPVVPGIHAQRKEEFVAAACCKASRWFEVESRYTSVSVLPASSPGRKHTPSTPQGCAAHASFDVAAEATAWEQSNPLHPLWHTHTPAGLSPDAQVP